MFSRRRHAATEVPAAPVLQMTDAQILELVHEKVAELIGENGEWTVSRRAATDTDTIFHTVLAESVSVSIAGAIVKARNRPAAIAEPQHRAEETDATDMGADEKTGSGQTNASETDPEVADRSAAPAALRWTPAPVTVWADLRKPVTGEILVPHQRPAA